MSQNSDIARARRYHEATKHSWASVRRGPRGLDWENMPLPYKIYLDLPPLPLPKPSADSPHPALSVLTHPAPAAPKSAELDLPALARLLYYSGGVLRTRRYPGGEIAFRAAACTGNLHHIDLYLVCSALGDLEAGVYHFAPHDFSLRRLRAGDFRGLLFDATGDCPAIAEAPVSIVAASTFWRNAWKYGARAYRHCYWDSGTILANLFALAAAGGIPFQLVLGFVDSTVAELLALDPQREAPLSIVALGSGAPAPPVPPLLEPLRFRTMPLSRREVEYPEMREMHAASSLATPTEVAAWRNAASARPPERPADGSGTVIPLAPAPIAPGEPIEAVIRRRGSTRRFARTPIGFDILSAILRAAVTPLPADFQPPARYGTEIYAVVHAVAGLEPGAYWFDRTRNCLVLLRRGSFRREAGTLALGQELAADAAADLFWLSDLDAVLGTLGNRGYRAAQLEAAVGGGRTYLAAFSLRVGATGLTFFDDDVTQFFAPHAKGKSVMFLMAVGNPHRARAAV